MRCRLRIKPNHRRSSKSESWTLAGNETNFELVVTTVIDMNCCLLLIMLTNFTKKKLQKPKQIKLSQFHCVKDFLTFKNLEIIKYIYVYTVLQKHSNKS